MYESFFGYARERYSIFLKKSAGAARPWTEDPILDYYKFCNVFREDDKTTIWLRQNVREKIFGPGVFLATILFRWFNRISTGEAIFSQTSLLGSENLCETAWEIFVDTGSSDTDILKRAILSYCGAGPYVTGSYCIIGMPNMPKLDGILECVRNVCETRVMSPLGYFNWKELAVFLENNPGDVALEVVWEWFRRFPRSGDFISYEVVTDLRHTSLLDKAPDIMSWANAGPGAIRGLNRLRDRPLEKKIPKQQQCEEMQDMMRAGNDVSTGLWPKDYPTLEMRDVEHTLCEYDKYERIRLGQGRVKGVYR